MMQKKLLDNRSFCAMTIDVEDYFHVGAFANDIAPIEWGWRYPMRVEKNTEHILALLDEHQAKATFFMLGWVAKRCPNLVQTIVAEGHELASHGFYHQKATEQSPLAFKSDVYASKLLLEDMTGIEILGYRAPSFSINPQNEWAFAILAELGFAYSSSTYPVKHDQYGVPNWPKAMYKRSEGITEIPIPTLKLLGRNIPIGGGGFFRLYPYHLSKRLIQRYLATTNVPYSFYFHPWEIDVCQPKIKQVGIKSRFRHYLNLKHMQKRISTLLTDFSWNTMKKVYNINELKKNAKYYHQEDAGSRFSRLG